LEEYFRTEKLPSFYAEKLSITLKHLNRICNEILQKTATEVITDRVILEIKRMLIDKQLAVNEVAFKVGYEDYSYFSRFFKKQTGLSPTEFRNTVR
jgi:AraC-like DNA-binding protein